MIRESGELKTTFSIPASYTKTNKSRAVFILAKPQIKAIEEWICERLEFKVFVSDKDMYRGLNPDLPMFAITRKGKSWRTMAFRDKKYKDKSGLTKTTRVCGSMQTLISELFKSCGLYGGSSHSGRRTLGTWLDRKGVELETIQKILGHESPEMTLEYIEPDFNRIQKGFDLTLSSIRF